MFFKYSKDQPDCISLVIVKGAAIGFFQTTNILWVLFLNGFKIIVKFGLIKDNSLYVLK